MQLLTEYRFSISFIKIFIFRVGVATTCGITALVCLKLLLGSEINNNSIIFSAIGCATFIGLFQALSFYYVSKRTNQRNYSEDLATVKQQRTVVATISPSQLMEKFQHSTYFINEKKSFDGLSTIKIRNGSSFDSLGEKMVIHAKKINATDYEYNISSRPILPFTILDGGKNFENVEMLSNILNTQ